MANTRQDLQPIDVQNSLNPNLSRTNPDIYRSRLFHMLDNGTRYGKDAFGFVSRKKNVEPEKVTFNPDRWQSRHNATDGTITLGTAPMTDAERDFNFPFETGSFNEDRIILHKFVHEIAHFLGDHLADKIEGGAGVSAAVSRYESLVGVFAHLRDQPSNKGVTSHAGEERYVAKGPGIQGVEDMTDLIAFYLVDPDYLNRYLHFLTDPEFAGKREQLKLATLSEASAASVQNIIAGVIGEVLGEDDSRVGDDPQELGETDGSESAREALERLTK